MSATDTLTFASPLGSTLSSHEFRQTELGPLPIDWGTRALGDIGECLIGLTYDPADVSPDGLLVLRSSNIEDGALRFDDNVFVDVEVPERLIVRRGDLLICVRNGSRSLIGKCALINDQAEGMTFGAFMALFRSPFNPFTFYCFQANLVKRQIHEHLGATINQITNKSLRSFCIPFPTALEQGAIAEALSDADRLIAALDKLIAKKRAIMHATMQQLLTGRTRLPGFSNKWSDVTIGDFTDCTAGGTPSTAVPEYWGGNIRWMNSGELNLKHVREVEGRITELGLRNSSTKIVPTGCVLVGLAGQGRTRGTVALNLVDLCANQSIAAIFPSQLHDSKFLFYNLGSRYEELRSLSTGDGGRGGLNLTILKSLSVALPELKEQAAIATVLSDMDNEISALEHRRDKTKAIKQGMMQSLLTGKVRLVSPSASELTP